VFLRVVGEPFFLYSMTLWIARVILIPALLLHIVAAYQLTRQDLAARPRSYAIRKNLESTLSSRTMRWGGVAIAVFIVYHVLDLTFGVAHAGGTF
jgi:succinate dehydrogenase / fumarate reductase cytochrome b subunit